MSSLSRLLFFCIALACAFAVSYAVYQRMAAPPPVVQQVDGPGSTPIVVVVKDLYRGDTITAADIKMVPYLQATLPAGAFTSVDQAVGRVVLARILNSQPVLESSLAPREVTQGGLASIVKKNKRAMAVRVDDVIGVAGFIQPGHLVDVLISVGVDKGVVTKTVLENVPVLSIGTIAQVTEEKKPQRVTVVTLEVSPEEAEKLGYAVNHGRIQLALRNYTDMRPVLTKGAQVKDLLASYPKRTEVEIMNGNKVERVQLHSTRSF